MKNPEKSQYFGKNLLEGKRCVVTGGGMGIGRQVAYTLVEQGADVAIVDYKKDLAESAAELINNEFGPGKAVAVVGDVSDKSQLKDSFEKIKQHFKGAIDVFVNNAGIDHPCRIEDLLSEDKSEMFDRTINVNQKGAYYCAALSYPLLLKGNNPVFLIMGSCAASGSEGQGVYSGTKASLRGLLGTLVKEWGATDEKQAVRTVMIEPDYFEDTGLRGEKYLKDLAHARRTSIDVIANEAVAEKIPLRREGKLVEVGEAVVVLALAGYANGEIFVLSGGKRAGV